VDPGSPWWIEDGNGVDTLEPPPPGAPASLDLRHSDSFTTTAGRSYPAGRLKRFFAGDLNRRLWDVPVRLPVLDLETIGGGLHPERMSGGKQTIGLRFLGRDGLEYEFRPIVKNPEGVLPRWMREGAVADALDDQMAAQFPFGAVVVSRLLDAVGVAAPRPVPAVMPNDPRLGQYRPMFAGRVGLFSVHPDEREGDRPGYGGYTRIIDSDDLYLDLGNNPGSSVDDRHFLRARLVDLLVGDWDRHSGQWRWGKDGTHWRAIPEDRDWAFARMDGLVGGLARIFVPRYVGFSAEYPAIGRLLEQADRIDHRVLNRLDRGQFLEVARQVQTTLTDSVIIHAVEALPPALLTLERENLVGALRARRDRLVEYADEFYLHVVKELRVFGFEHSADVVEFDQASREGARIRLRSGPSGPVRFERMIRREETREVVLFLDEGQDTIVGQRGLPFDVTVQKDARQE